MCVCDFRASSVKTFLKEFFTTKWEDVEMGCRVIRTVTIVTAIILVAGYFFKF